MNKTHIHTYISMGIDGSINMRLTYPTVADIISMQRKKIQLNTYRQCWFWMLSRILFVKFLLFFYQFLCYLLFGFSICVCSSFFFSSILLEGREKKVRMHITSSPSKLFIFPHCSLRCVHVRLRWFYIEFKSNQHGSVCKIKKKTNMKKSNKNCFKLNTIYIQYPDNSTFLQISKQCKFSFRFM